MFSNHTDSFNLKRVLEQATNQYDYYLMHTENPDDLIASCAFGKITDTDTNAIIALKIGAPRVILDQFRAFFQERNISHHSEGSFVVVNNTEYEARRLTKADENALMASISATLAIQKPERTPSPGV